MALDAAFTEHRRFLWGLCYRMTGSAADADDLVQETFSRALERPPKDTSRPWRPWLAKVAVNLSRDRLRRRRRTKYGGDWLPAPIDVLEHEPPAHETPTTEGRYDLIESVSLAFLVALEALSPTSRAVLLLRDVFDYSVEETAQALAMSTSNVKTTLHRARNKMADYEATRADAKPEIVEEARVAMMTFLSHLAAGDVAAVEALLAEDVVARSDGGGRYKAANKPVVGRTKVAKFMLHISALRAPPLWVDFVTLNGTAAVVARYPEAPGQAARIAMLFEVDGAGRIRRIYSQLVDEKLDRVAFA